MTFFRRNRKWLLCGALVWLSAGVLPAKGSDFETGKNLEVLFNLFREVQESYVDPADPGELMKNAANGMLDGLDPYTVFLPEEEMSDFEIMTTGKYGGIGALIRAKGEWVEIAEPYKGFAADRAGLKIGDRILEIDGRSMRNQSTATVSGLMKGDPGTTFKLKVERRADGSVAELEIRRQRIEMSGIVYYGMLDDSVGYVSHADFTDGCSEDLRDAVMELKKRGMRALVYDLRGNGGGLMKEAIEIVGLFVPRGSEVVSVRGREGMGAVYNTSSAPIDRELPLVVVIDRGSASASEIVAGALQDYDRAVIVGQRSFGKGLVQSTQPVGYDNYVKVTTARYYIPSGRCIQAIDYAHRDSDGRAGTVPDSLIRSFTTRNGRPVYDGGGIHPDLAVEAQAYAAFTSALFNRGYVEDFAMEYLRGRGFEPVDVEAFHLTDGEYAGFTAFMADREVPYQSETRLVLERLIRTAERENYNDQIAPEIAALTEKLAGNKEAELARLRPEIAGLIEDDIVRYFHYAAGVVQHNLPGDPVLRVAREVLGDGAKYRRTLGL